MMSERAPRMKWSFSLRALLVVALVAALAIIAWNSSRRLDETKEDLSQLQEELGHVVGRLTVEDETKFHAIAVDVDEPNTWRWRLYVPQGLKYHWCVASKEIPRVGTPPHRWGGTSNEHYWETGNEVLVTAKLREGEDGQWRLSVASEIAGDKPQMGGTTMPVPKEDLEWMFTVPSTESYVLGNRETAIFDPDGPILLLHRRSSERLPDGNFQPSDAPMPGFAVWLEPW